MVTERAEDLPDQDAANDDARPVPADAPKRPRRRGSRSQRRLSWGRRLVYRIAVPIGMGLIHFFWATCRIVRVEGAAHVEDHLVGGGKDVERIRVDEHVLQLDPDSLEKPQRHARLRSL